MFAAAGGLQSSAIVGVASRRASGTSDWVAVPAGLLMGITSLFDSYVVTPVLGAEQIWAIAVDMCYRVCGYLPETLALAQQGKGAIPPLIKLLLAVVKVMNRPPKTDLV